MEIVEFIEAQLAIDEQLALATTPVPVPGRWKAARDKHADADALLALVQGDEADDPGYEGYSYNHQIIVHGADWQDEVEANLRHIARWDPARILAVVAFMRRIVELHTTGVYRTYDCSNGDHIQEWQCERAKEPYTEHRYCEVCGDSECVEVPMLAGIWAGRPGFKPEWRLL